MERIVLEVDDSAGKLYNSLSPETKRQLGQSISLMLKKVSNDAARSAYSKFLDEIGEQTVRNGLTPEILEGLLASND